MTKQNNPSQSVWVKIWLFTIAGCLMYYLAKTLLFKLPSNYLDAVLMSYGMVSLIIYLYFFHNKKKKKD